MVAFVPLIVYSVSFVYRIVGCDKIIPNIFPITLP